METLSPFVQVSFDVKYYDNFAAIGYVIFKNHTSPIAIETGQIIHYGIEPYESGNFYKRELPCLLSALNQLELKFEFELIYIDANVWLGENKKGLGVYLYNQLNRKTPIIGISKTKYNNSILIKEIIRGNSENPLYISSIGIDLEIAAKMVKEMHGNFRLPNMIKLADSFSRKKIL